MGVEAVVARRRAEREQLLDRVRGFVASLPRELGVRAAVVHGSVARGDFNLWSDVDVLVVAERLPERFLGRIDALGRRPPRVQPLAWTPEEWCDRRYAGDPIVVESARCGVWLAGSVTELDGCC